MEYWLRKYAFWKALLIIIVAFSVAAVIVSVTAASYAISEEYQLSVFHPDVIEDVSLFFGTWMFVKNYIIWLFIVIITLIVLMVNDKYGPGIFGDYLLGRYFRPKNERRIFMIADIKDATTIAETLGERKYFLLLRDFFKDIVPAIVQTRGEVYQYVGDEVVISWKMKAGLKNGNAIHCFYHMKELIHNKAARYEERYGLVPKFKVGFHFGQVTVGELGQIKRDIAFSGDVLNTTARIQDKCNEFGVDILASREFADVAYQLPEGLRIKELGKMRLKGKREETQLVTYVS
jgi:adenylate cyclase